MLLIKALVDRLQTSGLNLDLLGFFELRRDFQLILTCSIPTVACQSSRGCVLQIRNG